MSTAGRPQPIPRTGSVGTRNPGEERALVLAKLKELVGKSYFEVLRLNAVVATSDQVTRAFRYLSGQLPEDRDAGMAAYANLLDEAFAVLSHPKLGAEYRTLAQKKDNAKALKRRREIEASPKLERVAVCLGSGRVGEASVLIEWVEKLHPERLDTGAHHAVMTMFWERTQESAARASTEVQRARARADSAELRLYDAVISAKVGDPKAAQALLAEGDGTHPLYRLAMGLLSRR